MLKRNDRKVKVKVAQSCPTRLDPMDHTDHGILWARILQWVTVPFSRGSPNPGIEHRSPNCRQVLYQLSHKGSKCKTVDWIYSWVWREVPAVKSHIWNPDAAWHLASPADSSWTAIQVDVPTWRSSRHFELKVSPTSNPLTFSCLKESSPPTCSLTYTLLSFRHPAQLPSFCLYQPFPSIFHTTWLLPWFMGSPPLPEVLWLAEVPRALDSRLSSPYSMLSVEICYGNKALMWTLIHQ